MTAAKQSSVVEQNQAIAKQVEQYRAYQQLEPQYQSVLGQWQGQPLGLQTTGGIAQGTLTVGNAIPQAQSYNMATLKTTKR